MISLKNLTKQYGDNTVVDNVSLTVSEGEFLALLGPSGCGKTTILRMIAGFEAVTGGEIHLGDTVFNDANTHLAPESRQLGMVFQSYALWPHLSVYDNVAYPLKIQGKIQGIKGKAQQDIVNDMLAQTGLSDYATRYPKALSGGQQQRVALARSLVTKPKVILLDEPLANLDRHLRDSMQALFKRLNKDSGITFIYVTHDQHEAMHLADKIAVLNDGKLMQFDSPESLYQTPQTPWVGNFIGEGSIITSLSDNAGTLHGDDAQNALMTAHAATNQQSNQSPKQPALIRPQHVEIVDGENTKNTISATVTACQFIGERYKISLAMQSRETVFAYHQRPITVGTDVSIRIHQLWIFPEQYQLKRKR